MYRHKKGTEIADLGLILAFVSVLGITVYQVGGAEIMNFYKNISDIQKNIQEESINQAGST